MNSGLMREKMRNYLLIGLSATPLVLTRLLRGVPAGALDLRPDPARFTIREVVAHLADWEPIFCERLKRVRETENPLFASLDEGEMAIANDYANANVIEQLARFGVRREELLSLLRSLRSDEWMRPAVHPEMGVVTAADLAVLILAHDGYHLRQVTEWLEIAA